VLVVLAPVYVRARVCMYVWVYVCVTDSRACAFWA